MGSKSLTFSINEKPEQLYYHLIGVLR